MSTLGEPEVRELDLARQRDEDVRRRHVAVNEPQRLSVLPFELVREMQPLCQLGGDVQRQDLGDDLTLGGELLGDHPQVVAFDVLEHDEVLPVLGDPQIVNLDDVPVRERRVDPRLRQQHLDEALVLREVREDPLDGDELLEAFRGHDAAFEYLGHAAHGDQLEELVLAKLHAANFIQTVRQAKPETGRGSRPGSIDFGRKAGAPAAYSSSGD